MRTRRGAKGSERAHLARDLSINGKEGEDHSLKNCPESAFQKTQFAEIGIGNEREKLSLLKMNRFHSRFRAADPGGSVDVPRSPGVPCVLCERIPFRPFPAILPGKSVYFSSKA